MNRLDLAAAILIDPYRKQPEIPRSASCAISLIVGIIFVGSAHAVAATYRECCSAKTVPPNETLQKISGLFCKKRANLLTIQAISGGLTHASTLEKVVKDHQDLESEEPVVLPITVDRPIKEDVAQKKILVSSFLPPGGSARRKNGVQFNPEIFAQFIDVDPSERKVADENQMQAETLQNAQVRCCSVGEDQMQAAPPDAMKWPDSQETRVLFANAIYLYRDRLCLKNSDFKNLVDYCSQNGVSFKSLLSDPEALEILFSSSRIRHILLYHSHVQTFAEGVSSEDFTFYSELKRKVLDYSVQRAIRDLIRRLVHEPKPDEEQVKAIIMSHVSLLQDFLDHDLVKQWFHRSLGVKIKDILCPDTSLRTDYLVEM